MGFLNISGGTENHTTPKTWEKKIDITQEKYGKKQTFESYDFLKYFRWSRNPYNSQNMGKVNLHSTVKVWENIEISHILRYLADLTLMRTHATPNIWECTQNENILRKARSFSGCGFLWKLEVITKPK